MANQKEIRTRIASVKKTKKITLAMKLVAAARVNRMQKKVVASRPYTLKIKEMFAHLKESISPEDSEKYPLLKERSEIKSVLLVVIAGDRGLCGAYNSNVVKNAKKRIQELTEEGKQVKIIAVGRKANGTIQKEINSGNVQAEIVESFLNLPSAPTVAEASLISKLATKLYIDGDADKVEVISTRFISMINNEIEANAFLPVDISALEKIEHKGKKVRTKLKSKTKLKAEPYTIFDPNTDALINTLLPMYIDQSIYSYLINATTCELAARMTAMGNATSNANDVINKLTIRYNKARQAAITQEISEIVAGAAAAS